MNSKIFIAIFGIIYLAKEVMLQMDTSTEYSNIVRQVNMQNAIINNLQRRLDKLLEEQNMHDEIVHRNRNQEKASCKCKAGPRGAPGPAGPRGAPGPQGPRGLPAILDDDDTCLVLVGKCPSGFTPNTDYGEVLQPLIMVTDIPLQPEMLADDLHEKLQNIEREEDLPNAVIVTNVPSEVFSVDQQKANFSDLFTQIESSCHFDFLRSFRRVRITFEKPESATTAKLLTQHLSFNGTILKSFFAQKIRLPNASDDGLLKLPQLDKQFLISPPASPPVGWEQSHEMAPVVCNFDLMAKLAALTVDDTFEAVYEGDEDKPKIVIHPANEEESFIPAQSMMPKTPRPPNKPRFCAGVKIFQNIWSSNTFRGSWAMTKTALQLFLAGHGS
uniref:Uncharacterized protein n=1 Tax=Setaria digitata TaxID=48799 RepID=A0A915Q484_9BILA